jgi:predicted lipoprotein with Yx(FWY)xxD motif
MTNDTRSSKVLAALFAAAAIVAACSSGGGGAASASAPAASEAPSASASEAPAASESASAAAGAEIKLADSSLGQIIVDASGKSLYMFTPDEGGTPTCYDDCATAWPPLLTEGDPVAGEGLTATDLGTTERTDGATQVTFMGWPLYSFQNDAAAGDANGQGLNDVWWVVAPDGTMIGAPES